jgi:Flp pilus assembly protein TadG
VEFAVVIPLILLVLLAAVEVAVAARAQLEVVQAAREGARAAATSPEVGDAVSVVTAMLGEAGARARVSVRRPAVVGERAEVTVTLPHRVAGPLLGGFVVDLTARASMRVER